MHVRYHHFKGENFNSVNFGVEFSWGRGPKETNRHLSFKFLKFEVEVIFGKRWEDQF